MIKSIMDLIEGSGLSHVSCFFITVKKQGMTKVFALHDRVLKRTTDMSSPLFIMDEAIDFFKDNIKKE